jgi:hypothetical protein
MKVLGWFLKNVLLPLLPFVIATVIRYINLGQLSLQILDGGELSFSMAMSCILILSSVSRLSDKEARDVITNILYIGVGLFVAMFACSILAKVHMESIVSTGVGQLKDHLQLGSNVTISEIQMVNNMYTDEYLQILDDIRIVALLLSSIALPIMIVIGWRSRLED